MNEAQRFVTTTAEEMHRRRLLTGSAATLLAGAAAITTTRAATLEATGDDARLVALADQIMVMDAESTKQWDEHETELELRRRAGADPSALSRDGWRYIVENIHPLTGREWALRREMALTPGTTLAGFRAKARVVERFLDCWPGDSAGTEDEALAWSLANDLLGRPSVWRDDAEAGEDLA
jgi:hypothetical protein